MNADTIKKTANTAKVIVFLESILKDSSSVLVLCKFYSCPFVLQEYVIPNSVWILDSRADCAISSISVKVGILECSSARPAIHPTRHLGRKEHSLKQV